MGTRFRRLLLGVVVAVLFPFVFQPGTGTAPAAVADCPNGTHWDTAQQMCVR